MLPVFAADGAGAAPLHFRNNCSGWYRKHFSVPEEWRGGVVWVYFEAVYHNSNMWLNGQPLGGNGSYHQNGYTSFWHRLDSAGLMFGAGTESENVLSVFANAVPGTGSWYAGPPEG